jgi:hypothetical protein
MLDFDFYGFLEFVDGFGLCWFGHRHYLKIDPFIRNLHHFYIEYLKVPGASTSASLILSRNRITKRKSHTLKYEKFFRKSVSIKKIDMPNEDSQ